MKEEPTLWHAFQLLMTQGRGQRGLCLGGARLSCGRGRQQTSQPTKEQRNSCVMKEKACDELEKPGEVTRKAEWGGDA